VKRAVPVRAGITTRPGILVVCRPMTIEKSVS